MKLRYVALQTALILIPVPLLAQQNLPQGASKRTPFYVDMDNLRFQAVIAAPPAAGTIEGKKQLLAVQEAEPQRGSVESGIARQDDSSEDIFLFSDILGPEFQRSSLPLTTLLSARLRNDSAAVDNVLKLYFGEPRPFATDPTLKPVCKRSTDFSYPSGHAMVGYLAGLTLAQIVPEKTELILKRAAEYGHNRVVCGVHYPIDVEASRTLALVVFGNIAASPDFQRDLSAARNETRKLLHLPASLMTNGDSSGDGINSSDDGHSHPITPAEATFAISDREPGIKLRLLAGVDLDSWRATATPLSADSTRRALIKRVREEQPVAVQLSANVMPAADRFSTNSAFPAALASLRQQGIHIYPVMGALGTKGDRAEALENWWLTFPELRGRTWYSTALGSRLRILQLDSLSDLSSDSEQRSWLNSQLSDLSSSVDFVLIALSHFDTKQHHPGAAVDPKGGETNSLTGYLSEAQSRIHAQIVVLASDVVEGQSKNQSGVYYLGSRITSPEKPSDRLERTSQSQIDNAFHPHYLRVDLDSDELEITAVELDQSSSTASTWKEVEHLSLTLR